MLFEIALSGRTKKQITGTHLLVIFSIWSSYSMIVLGPGLVGTVEARNYMMIELVITMGAQHNLSYQSGAKHSSLNAKLQSQLDSYNFRTITCRQSGD